MTRHAHTALIGLVVMTVVGACGGTTPPSATAQASAVASASKQPAGSATQTDEGGQVTVIATWSGPAAGAAIDVTLDTHSVDLDGLDLADAIMRNDRGDSLAARSWSAPKGGHHREGALMFDGDAPSFFAGATWVELVLIGIGDVPQRTLRWDVDA